MNISNFSFNTNFTSLSMCDYPDLIQSLNSMYCMSQIDDCATDVQSSLGLSCQPSLSSPSFVVDIPEKKAQMQQDINDFVWHSQASAFTKVSLNSQASSSEKETSLEDNEKSRREPPVPKKRRRKTKELNIRKNLIKMRKHIQNQEVSEFTSTVKKAKIDFNKRIKRRSRYIGVSKNNKNWQAMINIGQIKKYIGTFVSEKQAARAYDLYSVALRGNKGALNFTYNSTEMLERIEYYLKHKCVKFDT